MHWQLLTAVLVFAAPAPAEEKKDEEKIQGTWTVVSRETDGKKTPDAELKALKVAIKDGTLTIDDGKKKEKVSYKLDPSKKPKAIELTTESGKETTPGIYELDGDGLKLCWSEKVAGRPTEFASKAGSGQSVIVLKRAKGEPTPSLDQAIREWHKGLASPKKEERVKALKLMLPTEKDIEGLFPKQGEKLWPFFEKVNKALLDHVDDVSRELTEGGAIKKIKAIDVRKDKRKSSDSYKRILALIPEDVEVYEATVDYEKDLSAGGGTYLYHGGRWFFIRDFDTFPEELDKMK
jgi:uncharacterized protein (TIGR03067 family)